MRLCVTAEEFMPHETLKLISGRKNCPEREQNIASFQGGRQTSGPDRSVSLTNV